MVVYDAILFMMMLAEARLVVVEQVHPDLGVVTIEFTYEYREEPYYEYVMLNLLPDNLQAGDVLRRGDNGVIVDHAKTRQRRERLLEMYRQLPRAPEGDITL